MTLRTSKWGRIGHFTPLSNAAIRAHGQTHLRMKKTFGVIKRKGIHFKSLGPVGRKEKGK